VLVCVLLPDVVVVTVEVVVMVWVTVEATVVATVVSTVVVLRTITVAVEAEAFVVMKEVTVLVPEGSRPLVSVKLVISVTVVVLADEAVTVEVVGTDLVDTTTIVVVGVPGCSMCVMYANPATAMATDITIPETN
jgi:hypothetical protein